MRRLEPIGTIEWSAKRGETDVKGRVAAYKYPRRIWFVDSLPTGPTGKLLRRDVVPPPSEEV